MVKAGQRWKNANYIVEIIELVGCVYCGTGSSSAQAIIVSSTKYPEMIGQKIKCHHIPSQENQNMHWEYLTGQDRPNG